MRSPLPVTIASGVTSVTRVLVSTRTPSVSSSPCARRRQLFRQGGQDARPGLDQRHFEPLFVERLKPVEAQRRCRVEQLGGQLDAGSPAADHGDADMLVGRRIGAHRARDAQAMVEQAVAEPVSLGAVVEDHAILADARRAEVIGDRSDREHEIIVPDRMARDQLAAILVEQRRDPDLAPVAIDAVQRAEEEAIAPAMAMAAIADLVEIGVERSGRDLVQQRFPDMRAVALDQDDVVVFAAIFRAEPPRELKARRRPRRRSRSESCARSNVIPTRPAEPCTIAGRPRLARKNWLGSAHP
jgi:hypothetical protein